jgi:hypothetical protein
VDVGEDERSGAVLTKGICEIPDCLGRSHGRGIGGARSGLCEQPCAYGVRRGWDGDGYATCVSGILSEHRSLLV